MEVASGHDSEYVNLCLPPMSTHFDTRGVSLDNFKIYYQKSIGPQRSREEGQDSQYRVWAEVNRAMMMV